MHKLRTGFEYTAYKEDKRVSLERYGRKPQT